MKYRTLLLWLLFSVVFFTGKNYSYAQIYNSDILPALTSITVETRVLTEDELYATSRNEVKPDTLSDKTKEILNQDGSVTTVSADGSTWITNMKNEEGKIEIVSVVDKNGNITTTVTSTSTSGVVTKTVRVRKQKK